MAEKFGAHNGVASGSRDAANLNKALVTYPPPSAAKLRDAQREPFRSIVVALQATEFEPKAIRERMPSLIVQMKSICSTDDDQQRMIEQLDDWVRWHRLGGYYLSYIFQ